jgi:two-component system chemotaxis response regulator CheY
MKRLDSLTYLIVDDVVSVREFLRQTLIQLGASEILEASNAQEAFRIYKEKLPDIVFLDIELPDQDGQSVLKQIKFYNENAHVVMVSGHSTVENVKESIANGAAGFIVKPFSPKKITTVLKKYAQ